MALGMQISMVEPEQGSRAGCAHLSRSLILAGDCECAQPRRANFAGRVGCDGTISSRREGVGVYLSLVKVR